MEYCARWIKFRAPAIQSVKGASRSVYRFFPAIPPSSPRFRNQIVAPLLSEGNVRQSIKRQKAPLPAAGWENETASEASCSVHPDIRQGANGLPCLHDSLW